MLNFQQLVAIGESLDLVVEQDRRDGGRYSIYDNRRFVQASGLKTLAEVAGTIRELTGWPNKLTAV